ncbi:hypothetical protein M569_04479, partial [Genlisea aurea]
ILALYSVATMGLSEKCLKNAVNFDADRAFRNIFGRSLRFSNFLSPNMLTAFRLKHKLPEKLLTGYEKVSNNPL